MGKVRKMTAVLLSVLMLTALFPAAQAAHTGDVLTRGEVADRLLAAADDYHPGLQREEIIKGYPDGTMQEERAVTRAQALVMLERAFDGLPEPKGDNARSGYPAANFTDIPAWAKEELKNVLASGIVAGTSATTFSPNSNITDTQMDLFIQRTYALEGSNLKDDFYATVNKQALDNSQILPGYTGTGAFNDLAVSVSGDVTKIIQELAEGGAKTDGEKKIVALYQNILNTEARNAEGIAPVQPYLDAIDKAQSLEELMAVHQRVYEDLGVNLLLNFGLTVDAKDSTAYILTMDGLSPALGQSGYAGATEGQKAAYLTYIKTLFTLVGRTSQEAGAEADLVWRTDSKLAEASLTNQELGDVDKTYNIYTMAKLEKMFPSVNLNALFDQTGLKQTDRIMVMDPSRLQAFADLFDEGKTPDSLNILKIYCRMGLAGGVGTTLNEAFMDAASAFNEAYLGMSGSLPLEETASQYVQNMMSDYLGQAYVARHFSASAKADVEGMVDDILAVYRDRIQKLDWMSDATKEKAVRKLDTMKIHIGYPDTWEDPLKDVSILTVAEGGSFYKNLVAMSKAMKSQLPEWQAEGVDKGEWSMTPYTVNAMYDPTVNSITFPAGILQAPFYDETASPEKNLGSVGYVIAHEITHAFDNNGAKFDEYGNATDWWTAEDYAAFQKLCAQVTALYDGRESAPGIACSGALTLSENIADLGAVACLTEIEGKQAAPDYAALYTAMAEIWCSSYPREMRQYMAQADVHAPDKLRGSLVLQNFAQFYDAFGIQEGDGMWLAPENRIVIW